MQNKKSQDKKNDNSIALAAAGVVVGAAVMATVSNHKNQEQAQKMLEKVKDKASSYMNTSKKTPSIWKKQGKV